MNVLLIEPDLKLAQTYKQAFEYDGHHVTVCASAQQGISAADAKMLDVVVLELQLVGHSGIEFLHEFRSYADWQHIPVIIFSNVSPHEFLASEKLLKRLGVAAYHYKSRTSLATLLASVTKVSQTTLDVKGDG